MALDKYKLSSLKDKHKELEVKKPVVKVEEKKKKDAKKKK